ncbi:hypothetical protein [Catenuloplanes indicus]|uniref:Uncharacterized protein n=1 Tax=Catenuloplanes indicus TaxID=137267 RepID=A0AAE3W6J1_9ACTN|nr:hypothetical protein [Catenuloplanes indicus]MDQ0370197.1 hypothetical protein [Catenuloplanes indicus]
MTQATAEETPRQETGTAPPDAAADQPAHPAPKPSPVPSDGVGTHGRPGPAGTATAADEPAGTATTAAKASAEGEEEPERAADRPDADFAAGEWIRLAGDRFRTRDWFNRGQSAMGEGSVAAENVIINEAPDGRRRIVARLIAEEVVRYRQVYVPGETDERLERELARRSVVVLSGPDGSGRRATACVALARRHGSPAHVASVDLLPSEELADLTRAGNVFHEGAGHIVQLSDARAADPMMLAALASHVRSLGATAVVVIDSDQQKVSSGPLVGYVTHARPPAREVFEAHLVHQLRDYACLADCTPCRRECVGTYVRICRETPGLIDPAGRLWALVATAEDLARQRPRDDALRAFGLSRSSSEERAVIDRVLTCDEKPDVNAVHARAFRIACVLFAGEPLHTVVDAAELFVRATEKPEDVSPLRPPAAGYRALLGAELSASWMPAGDRRTAERRRAIENGMARRLVDALWAGALRPKDLLRWLHLLVTEIRDPRVRRTAALLAGGCAEHDFGQVSAALIEPWARASAWWVRESAALALVAAAFSPQTRPLVRDHVQDWSKRDFARLRDTVARAYAAGLSVLLAAQGPSDLVRVACQPLLRRSPVVAEAVSRLDLPTGSLLTMLLNWADLRLPGPSAGLPAAHAVRAFVLLASRMADSGSAPDLLDRMSGGEIGRADLTRLWQLALLHPASAFDAWERLGDWVRVAPGDPAIGSSFRELMRGVAADPQVRTRLHHQITYVWRGRVTASRILDELEEL